VRQTFKTKEEAQDWEEKVLKRMKVVKSERWLNKTDRPGPYNASLSENHKKKISEGNKGKTFSEKHKQNISKNHAPCSGNQNSFFGHKHSEETRKRIGNRNYSDQSGGSHYCAKPVRINGKIYRCVKDASKELKIPHSTLSSYLKGRRICPKWLEMEYLLKT